MIALVRDGRGSVKSVKSDHIITWFVVTSKIIFKFMCRWSNCLLLVIVEWAMASPWISKLISIKLMYDCLCWLSLWIKYKRTPLNSWVRFCFFRMKKCSVYYPRTLSDELFILLSVRCVVCLIQTRCMAFQPCGHLSCCETCTERIYESTKQCPACRQHTISYMRIFFCVKLAYVNINKFN